MTEVKYIALGHVAKKIIRIKRFINEMNLEVVEDFTLYKDNKICIVLTKNIKNQYQINHIDIQHYFIRKLINKKKLTIK